MKKDFATGIDWKVNLGVMVLLLVLVISVIAVLDISGPAADSKELIFRRAALRSNCAAGTPASRRFR